ncbi:insulin-degrading enzyme-like protein [Chrysochromulina tobinii]|uniref:Insulin-degrading enzyme-like protein n=1 Tax=Chrysochromulina tobinii TaxID=1460289 RepID=A0A0M0J8Z4_9EUKA|nr:insulin-degrading enzyme-like protein [Chrysochromulina tobinii]|eukprot:KOO22827.1 insulin-degrading enzyme-like protein [Chrysochromulina sp. CCMP291]
MGSERYPDEDEWNRFLSAHGGEDNGETSAEHTVVYFDVSPSQLKPALDRFLDFMATPSFNVGSAAREVKAIESEFQQARQEEGNRHAQLLGHLCAPAHPYRRFMWGDRRSLEIGPAARGVDMQSALRAFHSRYYHAGLMGLVALGGEDLDTLQGWVEEMVPLREGRTLKLNWFVPSLLNAYGTKPEVLVGHLLGHEGKGSALEALKLEGLATGLAAGVDEEMHTSNAALFDLEVELTSRGLDRVDRVLDLVLGAVGHLSREPTERLQGVYDELRDIAQMRFAYAEQEREIDAVRRLAISLLRRLPPDETLSAEALYSPNWEPTRLRELLGGLTPDRLVVTVSYKAEGDSGEGLKAEGGVAEEQASALVGAPSEGESDTWQLEPWFGTEFTVKPVNSAQLARWWEAYEGRPSEPLSTPFELPPRNEYIATDFTLRHGGETQRPMPAAEVTRGAALAVASVAAAAARPARTPPELVHSSTRGLAFHKTDTTFATPKAIVCVSINTARPSTVSRTGSTGSTGTLSASELSEMARTRARMRVMREVAAKVTLERMNTDAYAATVAGLAYDLSPSELGWQLQVDGFSHKLGHLLERVCTELYAVASRPCDAPTLARVLNDYQLALRNAGFAPSELAYNERLRCLDPTHVSAADRLAVLSAGEVTPESLAAFVGAQLGGAKGASKGEGGGDLLGEGGGAFITLYAGGNLARSEVRSLFDLVGRALGEPPPTPSPRWEGCAALPAGGLLVRRAPNRNPEDQNCALDLYWQLGPDSRALAAKLSLLEHLMWTPLFDTLRTKQQLGYSVSGEVRHTNGCLGFLISVVSATHAPADIEARVYRFLEGYVATLAKMPAAEYRSNQQAAIDNRLLDDKSIEDEAMRYWSEIDGQSYAFRRAEEEAEAMRATSQQLLVPRPIAPLPPLIVG